MFVRRNPTRQELENQQRLCHPCSPNVRQYNCQTKPPQDKNWINNDFNTLALHIPAIMIVKLNPHKTRTGTTTNNNDCNTPALEMSASMIVKLNPHKTNWINSD
jgi:hypothetical protein